MRTNNKQKAAFKREAKKRKKTYLSDEPTTKKLMKECALAAAFITNNMFEGLYKRIGGGFAVIHEVIVDCAHAYVRKFEKEILDETTEWEELSEKLGHSDWEEVLMAFATDYFKKY